MIKMCAVWKLSGLNRDIVDHFEVVCNKNKIDISGFFYSRITDKPPELIKQGNKTSQLLPPNPFSISFVFVISKR